jgi:hypothetical protein
MCPGFVKLRIPRTDAMDRLREWLGLREVQPPTPVGIDEVKRACDAEGRWRGLAIVVHEHGEWTVFDDLTGLLGQKGHASVENWLPLARTDDFVYAEYNDTIPLGGYAEIRGGTVVCDVFDDPADCKRARSRGMPGDAAEPITTWIEIAAIVDEDTDWIDAPGLLWIFEATIDTPR